MFKNKVNEILFIGFVAVTLIVLFTHPLVLVLMLVFNWVELGIFLYEKVTND